MSKLMLKCAKVEQGVLILTLNRPEVHNALCTQLLGLLANRLERASEEKKVQCVVLSGGEKVFAAGADVQEIQDQNPLGALSDVRLQYWKSIRNFPKPMLAAVNGYCLGGGLELAMCADVLIAGEKALFGTPEINLGLIPGAGGTQLLPRIIGKPLAMKMILSGEFMDASTALRAGLVTEVVPDQKTLEQTLILAKRIATRPPQALRMAKESVHMSLQLPLQEGLKYERTNFAVLMASPEKKEGIRRFLEKTKGN